MYRMRKATLFLQIILPLVWLGELLAISFMEAPLKFLAPNVTLAIGTGIGKLIFHALNKAEIAFLLLFVASLFLEPAGRIIYYITGILALVLLVQTLVLLPMLDTRVLMIQHGEAPPESKLHIIYIVADVMKCVGLLFLSWQLLQQKSGLTLKTFNPVTD